VSGTPFVLKLYLGMIVFSCLGTLLSSLTGLDPGPIRPVASILTLVLGNLAVYEVGKQVFHPKPLAWGLAALMLIGAGFEILGLHTGFPFGNYEYTGNWVPSVLLWSGKTFPILLPFAWAMIVGSAVVYARSFCRGWLALVVGAALATLVDLVMEPVMVGPLGYWRWIGEPTFFEAPWINSFGWMLTGLLGGVALHFGLKPQGTGDQTVPMRDAAWVFIGHLVLMCVISVGAALDGANLHRSFPVLVLVTVALAVGVAWPGAGAAKQVFADDASDEGVDQ
jgi:putative membrane protein